MNFDAKERQHLSADALYHLVRSVFHEIPEQRTEAAAIPLHDALMAGYAVFALKAPSLLAFDKQRCSDEANLKSLFGLKHIPCDTQMRTILDDVNPQLLRPGFTSIFRQLQRGNALEPFVFFQGHYLMGLDGTGYASSEKIHCPACLEKKSRNGKVCYSHQMLGAVLVHPDLKEVIPLCPEPIIKQDGDTKNDCERNARFEAFELRRSAMSALGISPPTSRAVGYKSRRSIVYYSMSASAENCLRVSERSPAVTLHCVPRFHRRMALRFW